MTPVAEVGGVGGVSLTAAPEVGGEDGVTLAVAPSPGLEASAPATNKKIEKPKLEDAKNYPQIGKAHFWQQKSFTPCDIQREEALILHHFQPTSFVLFTISPTKIVSYALRGGT